MITNLNSAGGRWLVVDDNPEILALTCYMVMLLTGVQPEAFRNAADALNAVKTAPDSVELIFTDLQMPGMDGIELCRQLRAISSALSIVLVSGSAFFGSAAAQELGFDGLIRKPFHVQDLAAVLAVARRKTENHLGATLVA